MPIKAKTDDVLARARTLMTEAATAAAGSNTTISKTEEKALPEGLLKTTVANVRAEAPSKAVKIDAVVDQATDHIEELVRTVDTRAIGTLSATEIKKIAKTDLAAAVEVARAYELITGKPVALPATSPDGTAVPAVPKPPKRPASHGSGDGLELGDNLAKTKQTLKDAARKIDRDGDGKLSVSELRYAKARMARANEGSDLDAIGSYARSRAHTSAPTLEQWDETVDAAAAMVERADADHDGYLKGDEATTLTGKPAGYAMFDAVVGQPDPFTLPHSTLYDHDGELPADRREPIDKRLPVDKLMRQIVWRNNVSDNDNHWPEWSGIITSRYRIGPDEAPGVIADIESLSRAKAKSVLKMLSTSIAIGGRACAYVMPDQVPLFDALAARLGVSGLNFVGKTTAPVMPGD